MRERKPYSPPSLKRLTPEQAKLHMLLLTADPLLVSAFTDICREIGVEAQSVVDSDRFSQQLSSAKYEGLVLDFDTVPTAISFLVRVREASNRSAVVFAVATGANDRDRALQDGAHFLLKRPIGSTEIRRILNTAYDLMHTSRRRCFRCAAELPVVLRFTASKKTFQCVTMNVSSNGMAVKTPVPLSLAETMDIALELPQIGTVHATGIVIWDDKHGKCGLKVQCSGPEMRRKLDSWLDSQFANVA
jgi:DNA-binding response OmpR family regulator